MFVGKDGFEPPKA